MAQVGLACLGIYLLGDGNRGQLPTVALTASQVDFYLPVPPGETVKAQATKIYFRFNKLKCRVALYNTAGDTVCEGILEGMIIRQKNE